MRRKLCFWRRKEVAEGTPEEQAELRNSVHSNRSKDGGQQAQQVVEEPVVKNEKVMVLESNARPVSMFIRQSEECSDDETLSFSSDSSSTD